MTTKSEQNISKNWDRVKQRLRAELGEEVYSSWFGRVEPEGLNDGLLQLSVPTKFLQKWLESHYATKVLSTCKAELSGVSSLEFLLRGPNTMVNAAGAPAGMSVDNAATSQSSGAVPRLQGGAAASHAETPARATSSFRPSRQKHDGSPLNPRQNFASFVVSASNRLAFAAAKQIAESTSAYQPKYNPLFFHADVGHGKTHLLQAIAWEMKQNSRGAKVIYMTAERFMVEFADALKNGEALAFKDKLRHADVLLIDDIQFLKGENNQKEFDHTINALIDSGRQVVVASAMTPAKLKCLDPRMRSRMAGGLVTEIGAFDRELRLRILQQCVQAEAGECPGFLVPDEVMTYLTDKLTHSGRELEGAITRLRAAYQLTAQPVTMQVAMDIVGAIVGGTEPRRVRIDDILRSISQTYAVSRGDLLSARRTRSIVRPRQIGMYLSKQLTSRSLPEIGRRFGGRDHTTVIHAIKKIEELMNADPNLRDEIETLKKDLHH
ncbi:MAG: chromosomal replication initiator protein DnaA [Hyphomicrobiaceae bacterium]|nr:chromosomal replication initiator protein DnaA [Hyphomicrobiaceae bacterium]